MGNLTICSHCRRHRQVQMRGSWWCSAFLLAAVITVSAADWSCVTQSDSVQEAWQSCPLQDEDKAGGSGARVRDSHQLSSSNGLGEEHNTEPKTIAAAASNGKVRASASPETLIQEQQKCPNSALKCPSSAKKSNQLKQAKTGKLGETNTELNADSGLQPLTLLTHYEDSTAWYAGQVAGSREDQAPEQKEMVKSLNGLWGKHVTGNITLNFGTPTTSNDGLASFDVSSDNCTATVKLQMHSCPTGHLSASWTNATCHQCTSGYTRSILSVTLKRTSSVACSVWFLAADAVIQGVASMWRVGWMTHRVETCLKLHERTTAPVSLLLGL